MKLPDLLIIANYKSLHAYMVLPDGLPEIVEQIDFENDGQTSAPLVEWTDDQDGYRAIAEGIAGIVARYQPRTWGLACPATMDHNLTGRFPPSTQASLSVVRQLDVEKVDVSNVLQVFDSEAKNYCSEKEHC